ncbi:MAG: ERCC4 domain-containing protein, partial [Nanoarchaeota archaeon]|nr:ERCC4 domain-containing protein [Nanoarchaeota archaeon]
MYKIKGFTPRLYQETITNTAMIANTLVCLPTGRGKTKTALMIALHRLNNFPNSKVIFLTPTKPLASQIKEEFLLNSTLEKVVMLTGETKPEERERLFNESEVIVSTPQGMSNDIISNKIDLRNVSLIVFDEAHRTSGDYDYVWIAKHYNKVGSFPRIVGLTASPGSDLEKINMVCENLFIEDIEVRTDKDEDMKPYVQETKVHYDIIELPLEFKEAQTYLNNCYKDKLTILKELGLCDSITMVSKTMLLGMQRELQQKLSSGERDPDTWKAISVVAQAMKVQHALELFETQGIHATQEYFKKIYHEAENGKVKANKILAIDVNFKSAYYKISSMFDAGVQHPKLIRLKEIIAKEVKICEKILIFTNYRDSASKLKAELNTIEGVDSRIFVGQTKKKGTGLSQKEQIALLESFKASEFNVLIGTSVDPKEYIILKNPRGLIEIKKIGEFVDSFISSDEKVNTVSKRIEGWEVFSTDNKKNDFFPVTEVHKHKRQSNVVNVVLNSGFKCRVTEDHSLFTFNEKGETVSTEPKINQFVNIANSAPNIENVTKIDVIKELYLNAPLKVQEKIFCSLNELNQATIKMYKTEFKILTKLNKRRYRQELSKLSKLDLSTITNATKRLDKKGCIEKIQIGRRNFYEKTSFGKEYLRFLKWFFKYQYYHKGKYRVSLEDVALAPKIIHKFCSLKVGVWYGKITVYSTLEINESLSELLGWYVAEGDSKHNKHSSDIYIASRNKIFQKRIAKCIEKGLHLKPSITWRGVAANSQIAHYLIKYVFKCGIGAYNKEIPQIIFSAPIKQKIKFLEGYTLGDGNVSEERITLTTASRKLAMGLIFLLRQIGIKKITLTKDHCYRIRVYESLPFAKIKDKKGNRTYYDTIPTALMSKKGFKKYQNYYVNTQGKRGSSRIVKKPEGATCFDYIKKIEEIEQQAEYVYDISVQDTERFYGGPGLICLHNSVGEEGIDIPSVDLIIFYEPVPSAIRTVQRRGRTGRLEKGKVVILVAKGTRDESYRWSAFHKENRMHTILKGLKNKIALKQPKEMTLHSFVEKKLKVYVDSRERSSGIMKYLIDKNIDVKIQNLEVGDFIVSERVGIERKAVQDFVDSIIDKRLLQQVQQLRKTFERPIIMIEGVEDIYSVRNIHPNAIRGMLAWIAVDMKVPIVYTKDFRDSSEFIMTLARREQEDNDKEFGLRGERKPLSTKELQEYIVSGLPGVGPSLAKSLLKEFGTVSSIVNASEDELKEVEKIG